jgi:hypothetical protein
MNDTKNIVTHRSVLCSRCTLRKWNDKKLVISASRNAGCENKEFEVSRSPELEDTQLKEKLQGNKTTHQVLNPVHENVLEPACEVACISKDSDNSTYFPSSITSLTPTPKAKHLPPTLKIPHPCSHPTARTYPSELQSSAVTSPVGLLNILGISTFWDFGTIPTSDGKFVKWIAPADVPMAIRENLLLIATHAARRSSTYGFTGWERQNLVRSTVAFEPISEFGNRECMSRAIEGPVISELPSWRTFTEI